MADIQIYGTLPGGGGTSDYNDLENKPKINNTELAGNLSTSDLGIVIPDVSGKEDVSNKITTISSSSTDTEYPTAKAVYDYLEDTIQTAIGGEY